MASFRPKSLTIQPNSDSAELLLPDGMNGVAEKSKLPQNAAGPMDSIQPTDPFGRLVDLLPAHAGLRRFRVDAPRMMRLVVDDDQIPRRRHFPQHFADIRFVALRAALIDRSPPGHLGVGLPIELMPIVNEHLPLPQLIVHCAGHDAEFVVIVSRTVGNQNRQPAPHRQARSHYQNILRVALVLRIGHFV